MRGFNGNICACCAHGDTDIRLRQCRCIIDTIADHDDGMPLGLVVLHHRYLVFRQKVGAVGNAELFSKRGSRALMIACQQFNAFYAKRAQCSMCGGDFGTNSIGGRENGRQCI